MRTLDSSAAFFPSLSLVVGSSLVGSSFGTDADLSTLPWDYLRMSLSDADLLRFGSREAWEEQCAPIFEAEGFPRFLSLVKGSNYQLIDQPNGLCMDILSCAWQRCDWAPTPLHVIDDQVGGPTFDQLLESFYDPHSIPEEVWNLPFAVVHPETVGDIIASVEFAKQNGVGMSVKTSGHSYHGGSTDRNSLMLNMRRYPKYASDFSSDSLLQCTAATSAGDGDGDDRIIAMARVEDVTSGSAAMTTDELRAWACKVATSRGTNAILRVGGGEIWDEVYRTVSDFNNAQEAAGRELLYHVVGGGAGTVSATGGYMAATGLSGTTGMRMFGFAADQVVQMEMVLPSGAHVRFGPTMWREDDPDLAWPRTTKVTGWCNTNPSASDESQWAWEVCPEGTGAPDFDDLWHAVRGGGSGYGVVTSLEYQLPDYPGELNVLVTRLPESYQDLAIAACGACEEAFGILSVTWVNFVIDVQWNPSAVGVSEDDSILCGGPDNNSLPTVFGFPSNVFCYGDAGQVYADAWNHIMSDPTLQAKLLSAGITQELINMSAAFIIPNAASFRDYATLSLVSGENPAVPSGRVADSPTPVSSYTSARNAMLVPRTFLVERRDLSIPWMLTLPPTIYAMGGRAARYHDGTTATSSGYREAAFYTSLNMFSPDVDFLGRTLFQYYNDDGTPDGDLPPMAEYNHHQAHMLGPLKTNWSEPCPDLSADVSWEDRQEACIPALESIFGTKGLARLERIKAAVDPSHLFNCFGCVGYQEKAADVAVTTNGSTAD